MDEKKFYWIKLRKDFFERDDIDFILSQEKGCEYIVLYQMLCMKASNNNGLLGTKVNEMIVPYDIKKITRDCKYFDYDTVVVALELYKQLGLIYEENNKVLRIADYDNLVGSETKWAEKKRLYREKKKMLGHKEDNVREEIEIEIEKDIEIDKELDIDNNISCKTEDNFAQEFELLWSEFPNKKGKDNAKKDFIKARKQGTTFKEIEEGLNNYITFVKINKKEPRYILNGSTWFHQHRWTDDYTSKDLNTSGIISQSDEFQEMLQKGLID